MKEIIIGLNWLDIIFLGLALLSLFGNLYQHLKIERLKEELRTPIYNAIVGLFMDIKTKTKNASVVQSSIVNPNNPHTELSTLKWEYQMFVYDVYHWLQGLQDELTGIISTLHPEDKKGEKIIRAQEFGLTETEKETNRLVTEMTLNNLRNQVQQAGNNPVTNQERAE